MSNRRERTLAGDLEGLKPEEIDPFLKGRMALFRIDVVGSQVHERFALLVAGFSGAVLTALIGKASPATMHFGPWLGGAALLNGVSLFLAAVQLILAHVVAQTRSGLDPSADHGRLEEVLSRLDQERQLYLIRRLLAELAETRFPPDRWFINNALRREEVVEGIFDQIWRIQRVIQWQGLLFRLQIIAAVGGGIVMALALAIQ